MPVLCFHTLFTELPGETVWIFGMYPEIGAPTTAKRGLRSPDRPPLGAKEVRSGRLQVFPK